ncbi:hypothetical protein [Ottowia testudinis]|uniref:YD repeat-containing protein n=1 Tax=Ottowia testudinis TaxID=2816950 RepID=A0A975CH80_9BURK|nr:hypothetical protein [Ottowia testudinis]QTD46388.1 hypothetical protein J1M35_05725 [Ottowia testudinis]
MPDQRLQTKGLPQEQYSYDAAGNRTSSAHQPGAWRHNADNQLIDYPRAIHPGASSATDQTAISYTPQGHAEQETGSNWQRTYRYNAAERLSQISTNTSGGPSASVSYRYDPFGRRIAKTVGQSTSSTTTYYLNGDSALMAEANDEGKLTKAYGFNPNTQAEELDLWSTDPVWQAELNGKTNLSEASYHYIATDHLGTPMLATNQQGAKTWRSY